MTSILEMLQLLKLIYIGTEKDEEELQTLLCSLGNYDDVAKILHANKFSMTLFYDIVMKTFKKSAFIDNDSKFQALTHKDREFTETYSRLFKLVVNTLNETSVEYALIKYYNIPYVLQLDIDLLIINPIEILKAFEALHKLGFEFYIFRFFARPLEVGAKLQQDELLKNVSVEVHRGIVSEGFVVGDAFEFLNERVLKNLYEVPVYTVPLEENIYSLIVGSWFSQSIPLSLIFEFLKVNAKLNIGKVLDYGRRWGTLPSIYLFLKVTEQTSKLLGINDLLQTKEILSTVDHFPMKETIDSYVNNLFKHNIPAFPVKIPLKMIMKFFPLHVLNLLGKARYTEILYDCYCHLGLLLLYLYSKVKEALIPKPES